MKHNFRMLGFVTALLCLFMNIAVTAQESPSITGIWLGQLKIPGAAELRMGVTITENVDNSLKATLRIIDQNTGDIPCDEAAFTDNKFRLKINNLGIEIEGPVSLENNSIAAEFRQGGAKFDVPLTRVDKMPELNRPQEPKPPFPYQEEEVIFENVKAGVKLAATLTYPNSGDAFPAVVLITGSGQQNRNEEGFGHKTFLVLADHLTRAGIAVLRADDRGVGGSTGNFALSTTADFAGDALAGIAYLKTRREINPQKIGLLGHSEGGLAAPIAAAESKDVAFLVLMAGPGIGFEQLVISQVLEQLKLEGTSAENMELERAWRTSIYSLFKQGLDSTAIDAGIRKLYAGLSEEEKTRMNWPQGRLEYEIKRSLSPWWLYSLSCDPQSVLSQVKCPVLAINGEKDKQVPAEMNLPAIKAALELGGNKNYLVKTLPGLNHLFQTAETGSEYEYGRIEETIAPEALHLISNWIDQQVK